ncbi:piwi-like protein Siwi [Euwallacea fornicatus]|uniref:piwi-like protein Siwi n=1 Tax=Euwallacea fornicatus TaxID=995702 RepID=UPI00338FEAE5
MEGRGRSRGRARAGAPPPAGGRPGGSKGQSEGAWGASRPGAPPSGSAQAQTSGSWKGGLGRGPSPQQVAGPSTWTPRQQASEAGQVVVAGRGSRKGAGEEKVVIGERQQVAQGAEGGNGDKRGGGSSGVRGRTNRNEIINTRPTHVVSKKGTDGVSIQLRANYFQLLSAQQWGLNQYRVDFNREIDDTKTRKRLVAIGIKQFKITGYLFDGTALFTPNRIHPDPCEFVVLDETSGENVTVQMRMVGEVNKGDYTYLQLFNIIIRKCFAYMKFQLLGRNYYDPKLKVEMRNHKLELWPGFVTSMKQHEQHILLNVDLSFKVLRLDKVYDVIGECSQSRNPKVEFQQKIIGCIVLTEYNNKTYRIDDIDFDQNPNSTFTKRDGSTISYKQYFEERYKVRIVHDDQPLLVSKSKPRELRAGMPELVVLVPELCVMTGLSDRQRENFQLMKSLGEHTRIAAKERMTKLMQFAQRLRGCPEAIEEVRRWDLQLADTLIEFSGRVLPQETLYLRNSQPVQGGEEADWTRSLRSVPMFNTVHVDKLAILSPSRLAGSAKEFGQMLSKAAKGMSMNINPRVFVMQDDRSQTYLHELEQVISKMNPNMVLAVLPNNSADRYNAIKKKCYVDRAIPCQVVVSKNLTKGLSVATKVAIQMNCKMGGAPWGSSLPKNTMVVGYDVCRDTANRGKSFAGMVASMNSTCTQYYSMTVEHENEEELSSNFAAFMQLACKRARELNRLIPERIIIYRDGVGDGQIPYVKEHEVELIKTKLKAEYYKDTPLKMAFIIVSKRINTKIFRSQGSHRNDYNPPPGTIVDDVITWPERYDFYIVSQCVRQGTVAPTSYNVIEDSLGIDANRLQRFTYKMTHMYFNWSGTVRVPAPCQYAHKLAFLTAQSLHRSANPALNHTLYYL